MILWSKGWYREPQGTLALHSSMLLAYVGKKDPMEILTIEFIWN